MSTIHQADLRIPSRQFRFRSLNWHNIIAVSAMHFGCVLAPFAFSWSAVLVAVALVWITGGLGVCLCYHRLLTHRSFKVTPILQYVLTIIGTLAWQDSVFNWVGTHRLHHCHPDDEFDPHSPKHGFDWSHVLCWMTKEQTSMDPKQLTKDLQRDPVMVWIDRLHYLPQIGLASLLYFSGQWVAEAGWSWVVWGCFVRTVAVFHITWFVNSAGHTWGYRNFDTPDNSKNTWWVGLLAYGEGWHNNHHADPRSARHGMCWWELDLTYWTIRLMERLGIARDVVTPRRYPSRELFRSHLKTRSNLTPEQTPRTSMLNGSYWT